MARGTKDYIGLALKGCAMGAADVVPGVSGGTIAFISGIYEELINSIKSVDIEAIKLLFTLQFKALWTKVNGNFLLSVMCGIALSVLSLAKVMGYLLQNHPIMIWSFFFGLIIASAVLVFKEVNRFNLLSLLSVIAGAITAYFITILSPASTPSEWWFIALCGAIAICAMILPGVSGSFILLLMGKYQYILNAISNFDITTIALFGVGAVVGIVSFSHILSWLLNKFHTATISILAGFMIGSLNKVWPWKIVVETTTNSHGEIIPLLEQNVSPAQFEVANGEPAMVAMAITMAIIGLLTIYIVEKVGKR